MSRAHSTIWMSSCQVKSLSAAEAQVQSLHSSAKDAAVSASQKACRHRDPAARLPGCCRHCHFEEGFHCCRCAHQVPGHACANVALRQPAPLLCCSR